MGDLFFFRHKKRMTFFFIIMKIMTFNFFISHPKKKEKSPYTTVFEKTSYAC